MRATPLSSGTLIDTALVVIQWSGLSFIAWDSIQYSRGGSEASGTTIIHKLLPAGIWPYPSTAFRHSTTRAPS